ncbi:MAG: DUF362 domain-containing protein [Promethearchaeota archaeon]
MTDAKVYYVNTDQMGFGDSLIDRLERLWNHKEVGLNDWIKPGDKVIIKTHFGSRNQTRHLRPMYIRKIVDLVRKAGGIPWVAECVGLGLDIDNPESTMSTGPGYTSLAAQHGITMGSMNAPVMFLDGIWGSDTFTVPNETGKYLKKVAVAMGLRAAEKVLIISRFKGHDGAGFGGALKQLGIGCVSKQGKGEAHYGGSENVYIKHPENCSGSECSKCIEVCPPGCLSFEDSQITLDSDRCIACTHCFAVCNADKPNLEDRVFRLKRQLKADEQVERMMDNAGGVVKLLGSDRIRYINIAIDITSHCDCLAAGGHPLVPDQGIFYSEDPIAIDQACVDLVTKARGLAGSPAETGIHLGPPERHIEANPVLLEPDQPKLGIYSRFVEPELRSKIVDIQLDAAKAQGIGSRKYQLIDITKEDK